MTRRMVGLRRTDDGEIEVRVSMVQLVEHESSGIKELQEITGCTAVMPLDAAEALCMALFELIQEIRSDQVASNAIAALDMHVPAAREGNA